MPMPGLKLDNSNNLKAFVSKMVDQKIKFGDPKSLKEQLDQKYPAEDKSIKGNTYIEYKDQNGKTVYAYRNIRSVFKSITDYTDKIPMERHTIYNHFDRISLLTDDESQITIYDTNNNGNVDIKDEVSISSKDRLKVKNMPLSTFLYSYMNKD